MGYPQDKWPISKIPECKTADVESEMKENNVLFDASLLSREDLSREIPEFLDLSEINESCYLSLLKLYRVTAWILRFVNKLKKREHHSGPLTALELQKARLKWDLYIQYKCYPDMNLQQDDSGLVQCHGRYENAPSLSQGTKCPKLLPKDEHCTKLIVEDFHRQAFYAGVS